MNLKEKIAEYFKEPQDCIMLQEVVNGVVLYDDEQFTQEIKELISRQGMDYVVGLITQKIVVDKIISIQSLIESNSETTHEEIDSLFNSLSPLFQNLKFDTHEVCKNYYGMSDLQAEAFTDGITNKNTRKEEFFSDFFDNLKTKGIFQELKNEVVQSVLDDFMFDKNGVENKKAYNFAFKFKKYQKELNNFDLFFEYLQENYKPNEAYELMSKFIVYVKTDNFKYDLLTDNVFDDEPHIDSLNALREKFAAFDNTENKVDFFNTLIGRMKKIQIPAKLQTDNAVDIYSSKITFDGRLPLGYLEGTGVRTPGPFVDYAIKNRCFVENNKTSKKIAFARIMAIEPTNDIFNHQRQYHKENIAFNKMVEDGWNVVVYESQKPTLVSKLSKNIIKIQDADKMDDIASIFDNLINLARNTVEKPNFPFWQVQIGKNCFDINSLDNIYGMTSDLLSHINSGNISLEEQTTINLIDKAIVWINTCITYETNDTNLDIIYSEEFRRGILNLSYKLNAPLSTTVRDLCEKLDPEKRAHNKLMANILIEENLNKKKEAYWKDIEFSDKVFSDETISEELIVAKDMVNIVSDLSCDFFSGFERAMRANGTKVTNIKIKYDDRRNSASVYSLQSIISSGRQYYHTANVFTPSKDYEHCIDKLLQQRNIISYKPTKLIDTDINNTLAGLRSILENPNESLKSHFSATHSGYENYIASKSSVEKRETILNSINDTLERIESISNRLNETSKKQAFLNEKELALIDCAEKRKELEGIQEQLIFKTFKIGNESKEVLKFQIKR